MKNHARPHAWCYFFRFKKVNARKPGTTKPRDRKAYSWRRACIRSNAERYGQVQGHSILVYTCSRLLYSSVMPPPSNLTMLSSRSCTGISAATSFIEFSIDSLASSSTSPFKSRAVTSVRRVRRRRPVGCRLPSSIFYLDVSPAKSPQDHRHYFVFA